MTDNVGSTNSKKQPCGRSKDRWAVLPSSGGWTESRKPPPDSRLRGVTEQPLGHLEVYSRNQPTVEGPKPVSYTHLTLPT
ncbi:MAG: hypothetical protein KUG77_12420, partial [Nannocystaceae bacterium]|nr:hypothetical protein [Nannocystaceae bacterium]